MEQVIFFSIFYVVLISLLSKTDQYRYNQTAILTIPIFLILFILAGFRNFNILNDTLPYVEHFLGVNDSWEWFEFDKSDRFEPGYQIYEIFIHNYISSNPVVFNVISAFLVLGASFVFFREYSTNLASLLTLFFFTQYTNQVGVLRQSLALVFFYAMYYFLDKRQYIFAVLMLVCSYYCHHSSILNGILFICFLLEPTNKKMWLIGIVTVILFSSYSTLILPYMNVDSSYLASSSVKGFFNLVGLVASINTLIYLIFIHELRKETETLPEDKPMFWLSFLMVIISILSIRIWIFTRFGMYYIPIILIYITNLIERAENKRIEYLFTAYIIAYFFIMLYLRPEWSSIYPYSFAI